MAKLGIQCPKCGITCELALDETPRDAIALVCPSCNAALVHYHGQTFRIDASELRYLRARGHVREAGAWIRETGGEATEGPESVTDAEQAARDGIGEADIANLRRDLETCGSVDEFLKLLG